MFNEEYKAILLLVVTAEKKLNSPEKEEVISQLHKIYQKFHEKDPIMFFIKEDKE